jgi:hypothetical protein
MGVAARTPEFSTDGQAAVAARHIWNPSLESIASEEAERAGDMERRERPGAALFGSTLSSYPPRTR